MKRFFIVFLLGIFVLPVFSQGRSGRLARTARMAGGESSVQVDADAVLDGSANLSQLETNEVVSVVLPVRDVSVDKVREAVEALKSPGGKVCVLRDVNSLLVADIPEKVAEMCKCIQRIDAREARMTLEAIRLENASPSDIKSRVEEVLRGLSPESFVIADDRSGKLVCISSSSALRLVENLISRLDTCAESEAGGCWLAWANASNVAARLNAKAQGALSRRMPIGSGSMGETNGAGTVSAVAMSESCSLIFCGTKSQKKTFLDVIKSAEAEARPCCEYEVVHTVLKVEDVKTTDEAQARILNLDGKFETIRSRFFIFSDRKHVRDVGQIVSDDDCLRYTLTVSRAVVGRVLHWSLTCSNKNEVVCQKNGTFGCEGSDMTIGAAMVGEKTACVFRLSIQRRALQLSKFESLEEGTDSARSQGSHCRRSASPYVVVKNFASLGASDGQCAFSGRKPSGEFCVLNRYEDKPVTRIGDFAFAGCNGLRKVVVPEGVTEIGASAFLGCSNLKCVELPTSVTNIGKNAFATTESLRVPDVVCAKGDKERVRKLLESVLLRDLPRSMTSRGMLGGRWTENGKQGARCEVEEALSRIREISDAEPRQRGLLSSGSLRARRLQRRQEREAGDAVAKQPTEQEMAQREAERAEQRQQLLAIQEELKRVREAKASSATEGVAK